MYYVILLIVIVILLMLIVEVIFYNQFQMAKIRISEAQNNIDILLQKKFQLLERIKKIIEEADSKYQEEPILANLLKIKHKKINNFELNKELETAWAEYKGYVDLDSSLAKLSTLKNIGFELIEIDNDLKASKKYYNNHIILYNNLVKRFPSNLVAKVFH